MPPSRALAGTAANQAIACRGQSVWILPEGTRSRGRGLLPFRKGAFQTAITTGAPITLICFSDYLTAYEQGTGDRCTVTARVLPPIPTEDLGTADIPDLMARCRALMIQHLTELNGVSPVPEDQDRQQVA